MVGRKRRVTCTMALKTCRSVIDHVVVICYCRMAFNRRSEVRVSCRKKADGILKPGSCWRTASLTLFHHRSPCARTHLYTLLNPVQPVIVMSNVRLQQIISASKLKVFHCTWPFITNLSVCCWDLQTSTFLPTIEPDDRLDIGNNIPTQQKLL